MKKGCKKVDLEKKPLLCLAFSSAKQGHKGEGRIKQGLK
jgi:hypothetical protein